MTATPRRRNLIRSLVTAGIAGAVATGVFGVSLKDIPGQLPFSLPAFSGAGGIVVGLLVGFGLLMFEEMERSWAQQLLKRLDPVRGLRRRTQLRHYAEHLTDHASEIQLYGAATRGPHAMRLPALHISSELGRPGAARRQSLHRMVERDERQAYIVIGEPGSGKTTLLRHTALQLCRDRRRMRRRTPLLLYLRDHVEAILADPVQTTLETLLEDNPSLRHHSIEKAVREQLQQDRCVIMLDGLDEMAGPEKRQEVARWIKTQMECHPRSDFIITARRQGYDNTVLADLDTLEIQPFDWDQITQFTRQWCRTVQRQESERPDSEAADRDSARLLRLFRDNTELGDLVSNPLLLIMACNVDRYRGHLSDSRAELYQEMCEMLIHRRRQQTGVRSRFDPLTGRQKVLPLRSLALSMMDQRIRRIDGAGAIAVFGEELRLLPRRIEPEDYLAQAVENGILREDGRDSYCFVHATVQEYLAAVALRDTGQSDFLAEQVEQPWWRETILLWAAECDASAVVRECLRLRDADALVLADQCVKVARQVEPELAAELKRLLDSDTASSKERSLVDDSLLRAYLQAGVDLSGGVRLATDPLPYRLWSRFLTDLRFNDCLDPPGRIHDGEDAVRMWPVYVDRFMSWAASYAPPGQRYRLPTPQELEEYASRLPPEAVDFPIWVDGPEHPVLHCLDGVPKVFHAERAAVVEAMRVDRARTLGHRLVAIAVHTAMRRGSAEVSNPLQFRTSFDWARAVDHGTPAHSILDRAFRQLLSQVRAFSDMSGWHPQFDWEDYLVRVGDTEFVRALEARGDFPEQLGESDVLAVRAGLVLASVWTKEAADQPASDLTFATAVRLLDDMGAPPDGEGETVYPDQVVSEVRAAAERIAGGSTEDERFAPLLGKTGDLLDDCADLLGPVLRRQRRFDAQVVSCARTALVSGTAVALILLEDDEAARLLRRAIAGLTVLESRVGPGETPPDRLLLAVEPFDHEQAAAVPVPVSVPPGAWRRLRQWLRSLRQ
ncbi:NACHT domain-containing protein [Glycomyces buryatensis]|uniref:NACHT domain-containing protein n=1 Tax=Glycomyces buryatensis TaxID=2570927 RepID=A0A4S8QB68_9ACTN|nr:NACHT domain-containing protein [Glycomyces buryatensis]THV41727.1 NACHT domain-containing protein [Glycomyces buryatensis]